MCAVCVLCMHACSGLLVVVSNMSAGVCVPMCALRMLHIPVKPCFHIVECVAVNSCWSREAIGSLRSPVNRIWRIRWCRSNHWRERRSDSLSSLQLLRCQYLYFCTSKASKLSTLSVAVGASAGAAAIAAAAVVENGGGEGGGAASGLSASA